MVTLYNNSITLDFDPKTHKYLVTDGEEQFFAPSVTSVLRIIDKSGPLMNWAVNCTLDVCKTAIQPNTLHSEVYLEQVWEQARKSHRQVKEQAADIGTQAHRWLERYSRTGEVPHEEVSDEVLSCVNAGLDWINGHNSVVVACERPVYSKNHRVAGTLDQLAMIAGKLCVVDFKTSAGLYPEFYLQTAAYAAMYEEETGEKVGRWLVRLGKNGEFEAHELHGQKKDWAAFLAAHKLGKRIGELR